MEYKDAITRKKFLPTLLLETCMGDWNRKTQTIRMQKKNPIKWRYCFVITDIRFNKKKQLYYKYKICKPDGDFICSTSPHGTDKFTVAHFEDLVLIKNINK